MDTKARIILKSQIKIRTISKNKIHIKVSIIFLSFGCWRGWLRPHLVHSDDAGRSSQKSSSFSVDFSWEGKVKCHWSIQYQSHRINYQWIQFLLLVCVALSHFKILPFPCKYRSSLSSMSNSQRTIQEHPSIHTIPATFCYEQGSPEIINKIL